MSSMDGLALSTIGRIVSQRDVVRVRPLVVAPAHVHPHPVGGNVGDGVVQRLDMDLGAAQKVGIVQVLEARVTAHREVRTVDLQDEAGADDLFVLRPHRGADRVHVGLMRPVVLIGMKHTDGAR